MAQRSLGGAARGVPLLAQMLLAFACGETPDYFGDDDSGTGGRSPATGGAGSGGASGSGGGATGGRTTGGTAGTSSGGGSLGGSSAGGNSNGGSAGDESGGTGGTGNGPGSGGSESSGGEAGGGGAGEGGGENQAGAGGEGGAIGSSGEGGGAGDDGSGGEAGGGGDGGDPGSGGSETGGTSGAGVGGVAGGGGVGGLGGVAGGGGVAGVAGGGGLGGIRGASGKGGTAGKAGSGGKGGSGGCTSNPERCDGVNNNCTNGADEGGACPMGCTGSTRNGHVYVLCYANAAANHVTWGTAAERCVGAVSTAAGVTLELARIEDVDENTFILDWISTRNLQTGVWMGANDIDVNDSWAWGTGGSRVPFFTDDVNGGEAIGDSFIDWGSGRPNGDEAGDPDEDCGHYDPIYGWRWNDRGCSNPLPGYVCEQVP